MVLLWLGLHAKQAAYSLKSPFERTKPRTSSYGILNSQRSRSTTKLLNRHRIKNMRNVCIALCLSLFASFIHAGSILSSTDRTGQFNSERMVQHDCHTQSDLDAEKSQSTNSHAHHQCCIGVVATLSSYQYRQSDFSNLFASQVTELIIEAMPSYIFKPPKQIS